MSPTPLPLIERFLRQADERAGAPALVGPHGPVTYAELAATAQGMAESLRDIAGDDGAPLCLLARKSPAAIALVLACLMLGRRFLLPAGDLPAATLEDLVVRAGCGRTVSTDADALHRYPGLPVVAVRPREDARRIAPRPHPQAPGDAVHFMLTTSGSTGRPKIVPLPDDGIARFIDWAGGQFALGPGGTTLSYAPLNFDLCLLDIWATLAHGGCVLLVDQERATNGTYLLELLEAHPVALIQAVPMFYRLLAEASARRSARFDRVGSVVFTGDAMPVRTLAALPRVFPRARLFNIYGCTETNDSFIAEVAPAEVPTLQRVPIGRPLPGVDTLVVDADQGVIDGPGRGELWVATPFQTRGYLGHQGDDKFVAVAGRDGDVVYFRSGDLVERHADGRFTLEGRMDFHVKVRGVRVNLQDVERVILQHADVVEGAVVAVPDPTAGHRLHAQIRRRAVSPLNSLSVFQHCAHRLARTAVPSSIVIDDGPLPKTSTGKVDRRLILQNHIREKKHVL
ncbi:AMP-binding protein [Marinivivus vitaminiproducens]|uniref:AMP-binding protein n=1 Tax=Marinivivus vitaminiproducens TaxID=3035935 RepID=UPI00279EFBF4|nr:AMP-binding protein [Geminicoccaceae bacterium SCSIO 64248]